jgi:alkylhydroperoxidase/carboxymuconolactone decarboxylase family protein YurZ
MHRSLGPDAAEGEVGMDRLESLLRRIALNDERVMRSMLDVRTGCPEASLDPKTGSLVLLAGLLAQDASPSSCLWGVEEAFASGASAEEIVGTLVAVAPAVGMARTVRAAPSIARAIGYDLESGFEHLDDRDR